MSTVRPPSQFSAATLQDGPQQALDYEVAGEKAASLGHAGHVVAERMAALRAFQGDEIDRISLLKATADAVWAYFIQRELSGALGRKVAFPAESTRKTCATICHWALRPLDNNRRPA
jgi:hypothetical protein